MAEYPDSFDLDNFLSDLDAAYSLLPGKPCITVQDRILAVELTQASHEQHKSGARLPLALKPVLARSQEQLLAFERVAKRHTTNQPRQTEFVVRDNNITRRIHPLVLNVIGALIVSTIIIFIFLSSYNEWNPDPIEIPNIDVGEQTPLSAARPDQIEENNPIVSSPTQENRTHSLLKYTAAFIPLGVALLLLVFSFLKNQLFLNRKTTDPEDFLDTLFSQETAMDAFGDLNWQPLLNSTEHREIDVHSSIKDTIRNNGLLTLVEKGREVSAGIVVLVERRRRDDVDAQRILQTFNSLANIAPVYVFTYLGSPSAVIAENPPPNSAYLDELTWRTDAKTIVLAGNPRSLSRGGAGELATWTKHLETKGSGGGSWERGFFFTRLPFEKPGHILQQIRGKLGFEIGWFCRENVLTLGQANPKLITTPRTMTWRQERLPDFFSNDPERLMQDQAMSQRDKDRLIPELFAWLGEDGLRWLRALAHYPILRWDLSNDLRAHLGISTHNDKVDNLAARLSSLVWFEYGYLPRWIRKQLKSTSNSVAREDAAKVIDRITQLLSESNSVQNPGSIRFDLAKKQPLLSAHKTLKVDTIYADTQDNRLKSLKEIEAPENLVSYYTALKEQRKIFLTNIIGALACSGVLLTFIWALKPSFVFGLIAAIVLSAVLLLSTNPLAGFHQLYSHTNNSMGDTIARFLKPVGFAIRFARARIGSAQRLIQTFTNKNVWTKFLSRFLNPFIYWPVNILLFLSWFSTTLGLVGLIRGGRIDFPLENWLGVSLLIFSVTLIRQRLLNQALRTSTWSIRGTALSGYFALSTISITFSFACYWNSIEARAQTYGDARSSIAYNAAILELKRAELNAIRDAYFDLTNASRSAYERELSDGFTCGGGAGDGPGNGPRREFRRQTCETFQRYATEVAIEINHLSTGTPGEIITPEGCHSRFGIAESTETTNANLEALNTSLKQIIELEPEASPNLEPLEARKAEFDKINGLLLQFESRFAIFLRGPLVAGRIDELNTLADEFSDTSLIRRGPNSQGAISSFKCPDEEFARLLSSAADTLTTLSETEIRFERLALKDGVEATREAFVRLTSTIMSLSPSNIAPSEGQLETQLRAEIVQLLDEPVDGENTASRLRELQSQLQEVLATKDRDGGMRRGDYPPLFIALFIELLILLGSIMDVRNNRTRFAPDITKEMTENIDQEMSLSTLVTFASKAADEDSEFKLLMNYSTQIGGEQFIVEPLDFSDDEHIRVDDKAIISLIQALAAKGRAKRAFFLFGASTAKISRLLEEQESQASGRKKYQLWRVKKRFWREVLQDAIKRSNDNTPNDA